jgi:hypothetical protein
MSRDEKIDRGHLRPGNRFQVTPQQRRQRKLSQVGRELACLAGLIGEWKLLCVRLEKEIEGVEHRHLGDEVHLDPQLTRLVGKREAREIVGLGVLLPVDEVFCRLHAQGERQDAGAAMRGRSQAHELWTEADQPVVPVVGDVCERNMNGQGDLPHGGTAVWSFAAAALYGLETAPFAHQFGP